MHFSQMYDMIRFSVGFLHLVQAPGLFESVLHLAQPQTSFPFTRNVPLLHFGHNPGLDETASHLVQAL